MVTLPRIPRWKKLSDTARKALGGGGYYRAADDDNASNFDDDKSKRLEGLSKKVRRTIAFVQNNDDATTSIVLNDHLGTPGALKLAESLIGNTVVTGIDLCGTNICLGGVKALAKVLTEGGIIRKFRLVSDHIGFAGAGHLASLLRADNASLTELLLGNNILGEDGAVSIARALIQGKACCLCKLELWGNGIGDVGAKAIAEALMQANTQLTELNLAENGITHEGADALGQALRSNVMLRDLSLRMNRICDHGAWAIAEALVANTALKGLNISHNSIGIGGADAVSHALKCNCTLTHLDITANWGCFEATVSVRKIAEALECNTVLRTISLSDNKIPDEGAKALSSALQTNITLEELDVSNNSIKDEGATAFLVVLSSHPKMTSLCMDGNQITRIMAESIQVALEANKRISIISTWPTEVEPVAVTGPSHGVSCEALPDNVPLFVTCFSSEGSQQAGRSVPEIIDVNPRPAEKQIPTEGAVDPRSDSEIGSSSLVHEKSTEKDVDQSSNWDPLTHEFFEIDCSAFANEKNIDKETVGPSGIANCDPPSRDFVGASVSTAGSTSATTEYLADGYGKSQGIRHLASAVGLASEMEELCYSLDCFQANSSTNQTTTMLVSQVHRALLSLAARESLSMSEADEVRAIMESQHAEFYVHLRLRLRSMVLACETLTSEMVGFNEKDLLGYAQKFVRNGVKRTVCNHAADLSIATAKVAIEGLLVGSGLSRLLELVAIKIRRDEKVAVARVAYFAAMAMLEEGCEGAGIVLERTARLIVRDRCQRTLRNEERSFGRGRQLMIQFLGIQEATPQKQRAQAVADDVIGTLMCPDEDTALAKSIEAVGKRRRTHGEPKLHEALAAAALGISIDEVLRLPEVEVTKCEECGAVDDRGAEESATHRKRIFKFPTNARSGSSSRNDNDDGIGSIETPGRRMDGDQSERQDGIEDIELLEAQISRGLKDVQRIVREASDSTIRMANEQGSAREETDEHRDCKFVGSNRKKPSPSHGEIVGRLEELEDSVFDNVDKLQQLDSAIEDFRRQVRKGPNQRRRSNEGLGENGFDEGGGLVRVFADAIDSPDSRRELDELKARDADKDERMQVFEEEIVRLKATIVTMLQQFEGIREHQQSQSDHQRPRRRRKNGGCRCWMGS